jgi:hypothetical protein
MVKRERKTIFTDPNNAYVVFASANPLKQTKFYLIELIIIVHRQDMAFLLILPCGVVELTPEDPR